METEQQPATYSERGYTWPMTIKQRDRILYSTSPDMRAVLYSAEMRAAKVLGSDNVFTKEVRPTRKTALRVRR